MPVPDEGFINKPKHAECFGRNYYLKKYSYDSWSICSFVILPIIFS